MGLRQMVLIICLILCCTALSFTQTSRATSPAPEEDILKALGTMKLADLKKAVPQGTETSITPESGSRLARVGAVRHALHRARRWRLLLFQPRRYPGECPDESQKAYYQR